MASTEDRKMKRKTEASFCDLRPKSDKTDFQKNRSALYRHKGDFTWQGIRDEPYKKGPAGWSDIIRRVLIGSHGESVRFHVRYFEIAPGGHSSLEHHRHEHVVICVKGKGVVTIGRQRSEIGFMDTVYVAPDAVHRLSNPFNTPFGFLCIVNARRDRPKVVG